MKKGDKVVCIRDSEINSKNRLFPSIKKGHIYAIRYYTPKLTQNVNFLEPLHNVKIKINNIFDVCLTLEEFNCYFITLKKLRKTKLEKIYEQERS